MGTLNVSRGDADSASTMVLGLESDCVAILKAECKVCACNELLLAGYKRHRRTGLGLHRCTARYACLHLLRWPARCRVQDLRGLQEFNRVSRC
jgi:hypothetical protein